MRLRRSNPNAPGHGRRRHGHGFAYLDHRGHALPAAEALRCRELVIPPAWADVWICPDPAGHIQATGLDAAGRRQYLYHPQWRLRRDRRKFAHVLEVGQRLPRLRRRIRMDLARDGLPREKVLALAARLLDDGLFRVGSDQYATGDDPTFGVATLQANHVLLRRLPRPRGQSVRAQPRGQSVRARPRGQSVQAQPRGQSVQARPAATFRYPAKGGLERSLTIDDPTIVAVVAQLRRYRRGEDRLLAYRNDDAQGNDGAQGNDDAQGSDRAQRSDRRKWTEVHAADINDYLRAASGVDMTAKDLRTWHGTLHAAIALAHAQPPTSATAGRRAVAAVMREVAADLGNTPTVARASYVDPRLVDAYLRGETLDVPNGTGPGAAAEKALLKLLAD